MFRKLYPLGTTYMAEADDDGDDDGDEQEEPKGGGKPQSDVDKLKSEYDSKIAELNKELKALKDQSEAQTKGVAGRQARARALATVNNVKKAIEEAKADPAKLYEIAISNVEFLGKNYADTSSYYADTEDLLRDTMAESFANVIHFQNGGEVATYKKQLLAAKTEDEMKLMRDKLLLETQGRRRRNGNGAEGERPRNPDGGRGSPTRVNIQSEMSNIDPTTPEGRKECEKQRVKFQKELQSANR
jgi:hypothetical protein